MTRRFSTFIRYLGLLGVSLAIVWVMAVLQSLVHAAPRKPHFTDIAARSHFAYTSNNDYRPGNRKYFPQPMCGGIAVLDYDHDGLMDLYFTNGAKLPELKKTGPEYHSLLLRNKGDGTFEDVTAKAGLSGAQMDFSCRRG